MFNYWYVELFLGCDVNKLDINDMIVFLWVCVNG